MSNNTVAKIDYDRRASERFPMERDVKYKMAGRKGACMEGAGTTVNMSSRGVLFTVEGEIALGRKIELSISWPAQLNENCALRFVAEGRVVRCEDNTAAVEIGRYEFRTQRIHREPIPIA